MSGKTAKQAMYGREKELRNKPKKEKRKIKKLFISKENKDKIKDKLFRDIETLFETKKEKKKRQELEKKKKYNERLIKDKTIRDIRTLLEQEEKYYKSKSKINFWNNNCIEYENNGDKNRNLSLDEYLNKTECYLRNIIIVFKILIHRKL